MMRIVAVELERAAKIAGRGRAERARALRHHRAAEIFGDDRAADMQAVDVAVAHIAERHVIEREAELILIEAAQADPHRPFIGAERIGRLILHAGQFLDRLERGRSRGEQRNIRLPHGLFLPAAAEAEYHDLTRPGIGSSALTGVSPGGSLRGGRCGRRIGRLRNRGNEGGERNARRQGRESRLHVAFPFSRRIRLLGPALAVLHCSRMKGALRFRDGDERISPSPMRTIRNAAEPDYARRCARTRRITSSRKSWVAVSREGSERASRKMS